MLNKAKFLIILILKIHNVKTNFYRSTHGKDNVFAVFVLLFTRGGVVTGKVSKLLLDKKPSTPIPNPPSIIGAAAARGLQ